MGYSHLQYVQVGARDEGVGGLILHIGARVRRLEGGNSSCGIRGRGVNSLLPSRLATNA